MRAAFLAFLAFTIWSSASAKEVSCEKQLLRKAVSATSQSGKILIFDTNVILDDPMSIYKFPGAQIVISGTVMEEIDAKKNDPTLGRAARSFSREMLKLLESVKPGEPIDLGQSSTLVLDQANYLDRLTATTLDSTKKDNELIGMAMAYAEKSASPNSVVLATNDINLRIKAYGQNIQTKLLEFEVETPVPQQEGSLKTFELSDVQMAAFTSAGSIAIPDGLEIAPNEFVHFTAPGTSAEVMQVGRYRYDRTNPANSSITKLPDFEATAERPGKPLNLEQAMALDLLLDPTVDCVVLEAKAGTGKTFLAMLAAFALRDKVLQTYISRPTVYLGRNNPGALPGDLNAKYGEWSRPFLDNYNMLMRSRQELTSGAPKEGAKPTSGKEELPKGFVILPFEFMRGRSIADSLVLVDEFQNTSVHEAKTILTRLGKGSKIVIMGDASQIDADYLNSTNNGLSVAAAAYTNPDLSPAERSLVGVVRLVSGVRSPFSELSAKVLDRPKPLD